MTVAEQLIDEAQNDNITVETEDIPVANQKAVYLNLGKRILIILSPTDTQAERACLLAEELGHHHTAPLRRLTYKTVEDARAEARARCWAHRRILPADRLIDAFRRGICERWELAEYFGVTENFVQEACDDYLDRGLL